tara:strand:+ start:357 stop:1067 length:711 start_codon:yes stop_codon:yes gene_type:complete
MSKELKLKVPATQADIQLKKYQKYAKIVQDAEGELAEDFIRAKILEIFCGITLKEAYELPLKELDGVVTHILTLMAEKAKLQRRFTMTDPNGKTIEFGFMPNMDKMSLGEYIDLEKYISSWDDMHKALAVMYRPIVAGKKEFYEIEKYEGSDKYAEVMKDAPVTVALGATVFFYHLGKELLRITMHSLQRQAMEAVRQEKKNPSETNGDGISQSMRLLEEMSENLSKLQSLVYTNV